MSAPDDDALLARIASENGYALAGWLDAPEAGEARRWAGIHRFLFTVAILAGTRRSVETGYEDRWCYEDAGQALIALLEWRKGGCDSEPVGWHRHHDTGRRRNAAGDEWVML
jgi:hypothetical protein